MRGLSPDERGVAAALRRCARGDPCSAGGAAAPGIRRVAETFGACLDRLTRAGGRGASLVQLAEDGAPVGDWLAALRSEAGSGGASRDVVVVAGDDRGFAPEEEAALRARGARRVRLGPVPLLASHCAVLVHGHLDALHACTPRARPWAARRAARAAKLDRDGGSFLCARCGGARGPLPGAAFSRSQLRKGPRRTCAACRAAQDAAARAAAGERRRAAHRALHDRDGSND